MFGKKLSKEQILEAEDRKLVDVEVPEWGGVVSLRPMSAADRDQYAMWCSKHGAGDDGEVSAENATAMKIRMLSLTMCDASGELLFSEDDVARLASKSGEVIDRIFKAAQDISAIGNRAVVEIAKNSEPSPNADSHSD